MEMLINHGSGGNDDDWRAVSFRNSVDDILSEEVKESGDNEYESETPLLEIDDDDGENGEYHEEEEEEEGDDVDDNDDDADDDFHNDFSDLTTSSSSLNSIELIE